MNLVSSLQIHIVGKGSRKRLPSFETIVQPWFNHGFTIQHFCMYTIQYGFSLYGRVVSVTAIEDLPQLVPFALTTIGLSGLKLSTPPACLPGLKLPVIRLIYIGKNQNPKNLVLTLYRLHCQKNSQLFVFLARKVHPRKPPNLILFFW